MLPQTPNTASKTHRFNSYIVIKAKLVDNFVSFILTNTWFKNSKETKIIHVGIVSNKAWEARVPNTPTIPEKHIIHKNKKEKADTGRILLMWDERLLCP